MHDWYLPTYLMRAWPIISARTRIHTQHAATALLLLLGCAVINSLLAVVAGVMTGGAENVGSTTAPPVLRYTGASSYKNTHGTTGLSACLQTIRSLHIVRD